jgi:hypothetical protein
MYPIGARTTRLGTIDGDTYVRKEVGSIQPERGQAMRIDGKSSTTKRGSVKGFMQPIYNFGLRDSLVSSGNLPRLCSAVSSVIKSFSNALYS